jgi:hypothetical protein
LKLLLLLIPILKQLYLPICELILLVILVSELVLLLIPETTQTHFRKKNPPPNFQAIPPYFLKTLLVLVFGPLLVSFKVFLLIIFTVIPLPPHIPSGDSSF